MTPSPETPERVPVQDPEVFNRGLDTFIESMQPHGRFHVPEDTPNAVGILGLRMKRSTFLGASALTTVAAVASGAGVEFLITHPDFFAEAQVRVEFNDVWEEFQTFLKPPTDQEIEALAYNPFGPITLTPEELSTYKLVVDGDSFNLDQGNRKNSLGSNQPHSWDKQTVANLNAAAVQIGVAPNVTSENDAEPGATAHGLDDFQAPEGNTQLGATSPSQMDGPNVTPPITVIKTHEGKVGAAANLFGNDLGPAVALAKHYLETDPDFNEFVKHPSLKGLNTGNVKAELRAVLNEFKTDKQNFATNYAKALVEYEKANQYRLDHGLSPLVLIMTLPPNFRYARAVPYSDPNAPRGSDNYIDLDAYPDARIAAVAATAAMYKLTSQALEDFHNRTGIQVSTVPILESTRIRGNYNRAGHPNELGERFIGNQNTIPYQIPVKNGILAFDENGSTYLMAA